MPRSRRTSSPEHYLIIFGSQRNINWPRYSHTFATFVASPPPGSASGPPAFSQHPLSWLPATLDINPHNPFPEPGHNFHLIETLDWVSRKFSRIQSKIYAWGPYQIQQTLFDHALIRIAQLNSGTARYVVLDKHHRPDHATNCIHALSDLQLTPELLKTYEDHGRAASRRVARYLKPWIINPAATHPWLIPMLGLDAYNIIYESI